MRVTVELGVGLGRGVRVRVAVGVAVGGRGVRVGVAVGGRGVEVAWMWSSAIVRQSSGMDSSGSLSKAFQSLTADGRLPILSSI